MRVKVSKKAEPKRFKIILCDPPWNWKSWSEKGTGRSASQHYELMTNEDIAALPISKLAEDDCVLFLWVTFPLLEWGLYCISRWGFKYKTCGFTWVKTTKHGKWHFGNGYWTRANPELCLLATRGRPGKVSSAVRQLLVSQVGPHSAKPPEVRDRIVELVGDVPRIELFARERVEGWSALGLEIDGRDIREVLKTWNT